MTTSTPADLESAVRRYFDLMYDCDVQHFDEVFHPTAQLHGMIGGQLTVWPNSAYREVLANRIPPCAARAPREEEILLVDAVGNDQALVKVRVRIHDKVFVDHLSLLRTGGSWRITAKTFHLERVAS